MGRFDTGLAVRKTLQQYCAARDNAIRLYTDGHRLIDQANQIVVENASYGLGRDVQCGSPESVTRKIDADFWRACFKRTGLTRLMDEQASNEFNNSLEKNPPAFTMDNIETEMIAMSQDAEMLFRRGIYNVFRHLDSGYWNNNHEPYEISRKSVIRTMFELRWGGGVDLHYHRYQLLNDIDRVCQVLQNKDWTAHSLELKIKKALQEQASDKDAPDSPGIYEDEDYHLTGYKNGNGHLIIKKPAVLAAINREIAAHCNHMKLAEAA